MGHILLVACPAGQGMVRDSVLTYLSDAAWEAGANVSSGISAWYTCVVRGNRIAEARNSIAERALAYNVDYTLMIDADMQPCLDFIRRGLDFLSSHDELAVYAAPYCGGPSEDFQPHVWDLNRLRFGRRHAAEMAGTTQVGAIGTGLMLVPTAVFRDIPPPWFEDEYAGVKLVRSQDIDFCEKARQRGVEIWCDWDGWSEHWQACCIGKPGTDFLGEAR